jgi:hypothetical protein
MQKIKAVHERDLTDGWGRVLLPDALHRKYPNAAKECRWQWVFPQVHRWKNHGTGQQGRHHILTRPWSTALCMRPSIAQA